MQFKAYFKPIKPFIFQEKPDELQEPEGPYFWRLLPLVIENQHRRVGESVYVESFEKIIETEETGVVICTTFPEAPLYRNVQIGDILHVWEARNTAKVRVFEIVDPQVCIGD